jgi:hypothetical protein
MPLQELTAAAGRAGRRPRLHGPAWCLPRAAIGVALAAACAAADVPLGLAQSVAGPLRGIRRGRPARWAAAQAALGVVLTGWQAAGNVVNLAVNCLVIVGNELASLLTLRPGAAFHLGWCTCRSAIGGGRMRRPVLIVEGGRGLAFLAWTRLLLAGRPLWGASVGSVLYTQDVQGVWMEHEAGHTEQARLMGPLYFPLGGLLTMASHRFEVWAERLGLACRAWGPF